MPTPTKSQEQARAQRHEDYAQIKIWAEEAIDKLQDKRSIFFSTNYKIRLIKYALLDLKKAIIVKDYLEGFAIEFDAEIPCEGHWKTLPLPIGRLWFDFSDEAKRFCSKYDFTFENMIHYKYREYIEPEEATWLNGELQNGGFSGWLYSESLVEALNISRYSLGFFSKQPWWGKTTSLVEFEEKAHDQIQLRF